VVLLRDIEGLGVEETAKALGTTPNAAKIRLHRARKVLRNLLADELAPVRVNAVLPRERAGR
jgi:RNA polymerase sigma-70 factor (ECF subfamily)